MKLPALPARLAMLPAAALLMASPAAAQRASAAAGISMESYRFSSPEAAGLESISLFTTPLTARVGLPGGSALELTGAYARGALRRSDGSEARVEGLTDTRLRLDVPVAGERLTISGIVSLPTGIGTRSDEEAEVASVIAADLLPFHISDWGTGGAAGLGLAYRHTGGAVGVTAGASYLAAREFEPVAGESFAYRPGNELRATLGLDRTLGSAARLALTVGAQHFAVDALDGRNLFRAGDRYQAIGPYAFPAGRRASGIFYAGALHRTRGTALLDLSRDLPAQNLLMAGTGFRLRIGRTALVPSVDGRLFRRQDGVGQGYLGGLGASLELPLGAALLVPSIRGHLGSVVVREGRESRLTGVDLGLALRLGRALR
jgi:hypothetical protein